TEHRDEARLEVLTRLALVVPLEVALEANPVHLASAADVEAGSCHREHRRVLPRRAHRRDVVLGVARRDARRTSRAAREVDRHRPTTLRHPKRIVRRVEPLVLPLIRRRRRAEYALRVGGHGRPQAGQKRVARATNQLALPLPFWTRRTRELLGGNRLS